MNADPTRAPAAAWWTLAVLFLANVFNVADRALLGVVTEPVRLELELTDTEMSLANGLLFVIFNLVAGVFIARMVDRGNRKRILAIGIIGWSAATAGTAYATDFFTLSLARIGVGIGEATAFPVAMSLIADIFHPTRRAGVVGIFQSSTFVGIVGGTIVAGVLAAALGWRDMFIACGLAGLVLAAVLLLTVREPGREAANGAEPMANYLADLWHGAMRILSAPGFVPLTIGFGVSTMLGSTLAAWGPAFLQRIHNVPLAEVGLAIGPAVGLGGIAGTLFAGFLANRSVTRSGRQSAMLRIPMIAVPLSLPFILGFVFSPSLALCMVCAAAMNFLLSCTAAPCVTMGIGMMAPTDRALTSTLLLAAAGLLGGALGPFMVGAISDLLSARYGEGEALRLGLLSLVTVPVVSGLALLMAAPRCKSIEEAA